MSQKITNRYASAVHSSNLNVDSKTYMSNSDTLGAYGIADRVLTTGKTSDGQNVRPAPLAVGLERLLAGDNKMAYDIVRKMSEMVWYQARETDVRLSRTQATDMAQACLAWHRDGTCRYCEGRGYSLITGTKTLSERECQFCAGTKKIPFERQFKPEWRELARWLVSEMARASGYAGPAAMRALAPQMNL